MRILITASKREKAKNYVNYFLPLGEVDVITPEEARMPEFDLLVLSGGEDVHPKYYGEDIKYPDLVEINESRDRMELTLIGRALQRRRPVVGICRGIQILTVALGGRLYQDLGMEGFNADMHKVKEGDAYHPVDFFEEFRDVFGENGEVNSRHHQGIKDLPDGPPDLTVMARSPDGLVEAFRSDSLRVLAVQWHPERHRSPLSDRLLEYIREFVGRGV